MRSPIIWFCNKQEQQPLNKVMPCPQRVNLKKTQNLDLYRNVCPSVQFIPCWVNDQTFQDEKIQYRSNLRYTVCNQRCFNCKVIKQVQENVAISLACNGKRLHLTFSYKALFIIDFCEQAEQGRAGGPGPLAVPACFLVAKRMWELPPFWAASHSSEISN